MPMFNIIPKTFTSSTSKTQTKPKKQISFYPAVKVCEVARIQNPADIWFSRSDELDFETRNAKMGVLLQFMDCFELEIRAGESPRGLEHANVETREAMRKRRADSVKAVLNIQALYAKVHKDGSGAIARAYAEECELATESAMHRAEMDEQFVKDQVISTCNRTFEARQERPAIMGRQSARRTLTAMAA